MQEFFDPSLGITHFAFGDVGSTNDEAFRLAAEYDLDTFFVTGKRQLAGRGRRGRPWVSEAGNLYVSVFLKAPAKAEKCAELSFVSAIALNEAISNCIDDNAGSCQIKWPNDILWNGSKISGLLLEARSDGDAMNIVVGMGVNCTHHPDDTPYPVTNFRAEGFDLGPDQLFAALMPSYLDNLAIWSGGRGFDVIRSKWLARACGVGDEIIVRLDGEELNGVFRDLNDQGHLILMQSGGRERIIAAGDVFFPSTKR